MSLAVLMIDHMFKTIVVGTDGSHTAAKAVAEAIEQAKLLGATLHVVSVFDAGKEPPADLAGGDPPKRGPADAVETLLDDIRFTASAAGIAYKTHARVGDPAEALLEVAEEQDADLIIVGNKGMAGVKRFLLGNVPNKVSHHAPCSVLIVKTT